MDEVDRIVDYIRELRGVDKVHLLGWSRGGNRAGAYAAMHPKKIDRLLLLAPGQYFSAQPPFTPPSPLPQPGVPTTILGVNDFHNAWDTEVGCPNQYSHPRPHQLVHARFRSHRQHMGAEWRPKSANA